MGLRIRVQSRSGKDVIEGGVQLPAEVHCIVM